MAQTRRTTKRKPAKKTASKRRPQKHVDNTLNWIGVLFLIIAAFAGFRLGIVGIFTANVLRLFVGDSFLIASGLLAGVGAWLLFAGRLPLIPRRILFGFTGLYVSVLVMLSALTANALDIHAHYFTATWHLLQNDFSTMTTASVVGGGLIGSSLDSLLAPLFSQVGAIALAGLGGIASILAIFNVKPQQVFAVCQGIGHTLKSSWLNLTDRWRNRAPRPAKPQPQPKVAVVAPDNEPDLPPARETAESDDFTINAPEPVTPPVNPTPKPVVKPVSSAPVTPSAGDSDIASDPDFVDYDLPSLDLLTVTQAADQSTEYDAIKRNRVKLKQTLDSFGVDVSVKSATLGPAITQYEIQPAVGVKVSKIVNLSDDLALALAAKDIRIEAPIPGKPLIGIEVPNQQVAMVGYREVLAATPKHPDKPLVIPLGKDVNGQVVTFDLTKMPHLLIAGSTGSGKSVMINVIITSILMTTKPTEVRLMLIDPKRVELSIYNGVPHLLTPVVTEAKKAPSALNKVITEMDRRYEAFAAAGVRNIDEFNQKVLANDTPIQKMPYIVVIVDELSDLMMVAGNEVETAIVRLAQMARAAGIHVIIATQRPSVDVITGLIKANVPSRIAFAVSSGIDSRTILDANGAEKLLGRGDMLYEPVDANKPVRIQGAFIPSADVEAVVNAITSQVAPAYDDNMAPSETDDTAGGADSEDEYYDDAVDFVRQQGSASTSMLQRRFRIGYNRAARLIDDLEANGIVGPSEGSKPRKVFPASGE
ncbi:FtsK/SpoIIIE family DNA translocase [Lacticaseibacillus brantae]|uniref:FtsK/SpoIIIE family DNA translocase n=1 Tax=Lacticaseibacillus brantae TaxID=943673 RepID=UPI00070C3FD5|nr:DNA translocase FtsK [Lacticaseibacillus brantae]